MYYSLRNSAVDVWNLIEAGANLEELTSAMLGRYRGSPEEIKKAVVQLLLALQEEGLVQASSNKRSLSGELQLAGEGTKRDFEPPLLEKYSDMQELLLLDPIHEVDEEGWPHKAGADGGADAGRP